MQQSPATKPDELWQLITFAVNAVSALGVLAAAWAAWASTRVTKRIFESAYRPYLGVHVVNSSIDLTASTLTTTPVIKNHGSIPAHVLSVEWKFRLNGESLPQSHLEKNLPAVFPQQELRVTARLADTTAINATKEGGKLGVMIVVRYKGAGKKVYQYEQDALLQQGSATMFLGGTKEAEE